MKVAVACMGDKVAGHFGHCENFMIFETEGNKIMGEKSLPNPGHKPGFLPNYLNDLGVNIIISGGMGGGAVDIFEERGIKVVLGAQGVAKDAVQMLIDGNLVSTGSICDKHEHADECGNH